jgi:hypothetical protein
VCPSRSLFARNTPLSFSQWPYQWLYLTSLTVICLVTGWTVVLVSSFETATFLWFCCRPPYKMLYNYVEHLSDLQSAVCTYHPILLLAWPICRTYSPSSLLLLYCWESSVHTTTSWAAQMRTEGVRWYKHWSLEVTFWHWTCTPPPPHTRTHARTHAHVHTDTVTYTSCFW